MKLFAKYEDLYELPKLLLEANEEYFEALYEAGLDINKDYSITKYNFCNLIDLAISENKVNLIKWLISKNVDLNSKRTPSILQAASCSNEEIVQLLVNSGANINAKGVNQISAMASALYGENYEIIPILVKNGYDIFNDGDCLRHAVSSKLYPAINIFLELGVNVNFHKPSMVFPYNTTPIAEAARNNDFETVKLLVKHGADVTIKDNYGERPYTIALKNGSIELINYIKSLEPPLWHNEENKLIELKNYKMPNELLNILRSADRRIDLEKVNSVINYIEFNSIINIKEVNWKKKKFLDLLSDADKYDAGGFLVWFPKNKCFAIADYEHDKFIEICNSKDFFENPTKQIIKRFE